VALSTKTRFEVLKRDRYTCSYCGKHPPDVLLEVDHITPLAAGGSDDLSNLTTACWDCNRGKGARLLEEGTAPAINRAAVAEMAERVEQAKAYMELLGSMESITEDQLDRVTHRWSKAYGASTEEHGDGTVTYRLPVDGSWPDPRSVKNFIRRLGLSQVLDAVDIAASRIHHPGPDAVRYFYGVCHHAIREGREPLSRQGEPSEVDRIGAILTNHQEYGFASLEDAVAAFWPSDG